MRITSCVLYPTESDIQGEKRIEYKLIMLVFFLETVKSLLQTGQHIEVETISTLFDCR
jgi:hypothetical protein